MFSGLSEELHNRGKNVVALCLLVAFRFPPTQQPLLEIPLPKWFYFPFHPSVIPRDWWWVGCLWGAVPRDLWGSASLMYFHICVSASAMMSPGCGERDWLATCHCGEDGGSGRGHDVISLSSSYTPAMIPKVVCLAGESPLQRWEGDCADLLKSRK